MMWSWILACVGVLGTFFVGRKTKWGWVVLFINECLWISYALVTDQYGFIFGSLSYMAVYIKSYMHWTKDSKRIFAMSQHPSKQKPVIVGQAMEMTNPRKTINDINKEQKEFSLDESDTDNVY